MFENPRRGRQARNFTTNVPKILDIKSSSEQIFSRKLPLGAPDQIIPEEQSITETYYTCIRDKFTFHRKTQLKEKTAKRAFMHAF